MKASLKALSRRTDDVSSSFNAAGGIFRLQFQNPRCKMACQFDESEISFCIASCRNMPKVDSSVSQMNEPKMLYINKEPR